MPADCTCPTRVTTWADGFGRWHAVVPNTPDAEKVARAEIRHELEIRGDIAPGFRLTVVDIGLTGAMTCTPRREFVESA